MYYLSRRDASAPWEVITAAQWHAAGFSLGPNARWAEDVLAVIGHERLLHPGDLLRAQKIIENRLGYRAEGPWDVAEAMDLPSSRPMVPGAVVTGGARGIDRLAVDVATAMDLPLIVYRPTVPVWGAPGGYKERNERVAALATRCLCIRCSLNPRYGAGWTADRVERLGKPVERVII